MVSSEVQRTLVKSPPELWAELGDPAALARHLGELGEIRIVKTKPEERVEWEAENATGTVLIKASGWGTKVTLSATREVGEPEPASQPTLETHQPVEPEPATLEPEIAVEPTAAVAEPEPAVTETRDLDPKPSQPTAAPRRGFFSRLFRRRTQPIVDPEPIAAPTPEPKPQPPDASAPEPETSLTAPGPRAATSKPPVTMEPRQDEPDEQTADLSAELQEAEEAAVEEVKAVLTAVLDRLGAAHHRPFSRS